MLHCSVNLLRNGGSYFRGHAGSEVPRGLGICLQPWQGCFSICVPSMRRELCKLYVTTTEGLTSATSNPQSYFASLQQCLNKGACCHGQDGIDKVRGGKKEGRREDWRGKWGIKVWLFPSNTDQWSENLLASHPRGCGGTWDVRLGTRGRRLHNSKPWTRWGDI